MTGSLALFSWFDVVLFIVLISTMAVGFAQGILRQVVGLAVLYIAVILGAQYHASFSEFLSRALFLQSTRLLSAIAFLIIVVAIWLIVTWLASDAYRSTKLSFFPLLDQLGGAILALVSMVVFLALVLPVVKYMVSEPWTSIDNIRLFISNALAGSRLVFELANLKPFLINSITPWMPYGIPAIFTF